jgi:hypothetical protein
MAGTTRDDAIKAAQSLPDLVNKLQTVDPALATQLAGKSLVMSRTPWGTLAATGVAYLSTRYGLGWSEGFSATVAGVGLLAGSYFMRWITTTPIMGIFTKAPRTAAVPAPAVGATQ